MTGLTKESVQVFQFKFYCQFFSMVRRSEAQLLAPEEVSDALTLWLSSTCAGSIAWMIPLSQLDTSQRAWSLWRYSCGHKAIYSELAHIMDGIVIRMGI